MRITSKGQVTIPQRLRERYGLMPETEVEFVEVGGEIVVRRAGAQSADRLHLSQRRGHTAMGIRWNPAR